MTDRTKRPFGFNVIGHVSGSLGLGVAARNTLHMLLQRGEPVAVADIDPGYGRQGADTTFAELTKGTPKAPYGLNLFQLNPPEILALARWTPDWLDLSGPANAIVPFWELPLLPVKGGWREVLGAMDMVLAPTRFVLETVNRSMPGVTAVHYPQTVYLPEDVKSDRELFGLPHDAVLFFTAMDSNSDATRKNPGGAIDAFIKAFGGDPRVKLVVKLSGAGRLPFSSPENDRVRELLASTPQVIVLDEFMSYERMLSLTASCDALVSLHRAEGLGLNVLEAMALGKPCITTAWSGTMDFTTAENSCLIGYELVPVRADHPNYRPDVIGPGQTWAEPDLEAAAEWMRRLADDSALRAGIGSRAEVDVAASRVQFEDGTTVGELERVYQMGATPEASGRRVESWAGLRRAPASARIRRSLGMLARSLRLRQ